jgi:hypothetical protein
MREKERENDECSPDHITLLSDLEKASLKVHMILANDTSNDSWPHQGLLMVHILCPTGA